ncbi:MAG: hypothetical protein ACTSPV_14320 [Candidatus Hodarchaeales archaeon]
MANKTIKLNDLNTYIDNRINELNALNRRHQAKAIRELDLIKVYFQVEHKPEDLPQNSEVTDEQVAQEDLTCPDCGKVCKNRLGLKTHKRYCMKED